MPNVAVILSGCGYLDGAEIREAVLALTALDKEGATVEVFAPNIPQRKVVNHLTGEDTDETRNVLVESARIARGKVRDLDEAKAEAFDALVLPGGFGAALNLSDIALKGAEGTVIPALKNLILDFLKAGKPIGAICISPAVLVASVKKECEALVTLGEDDGLITGLGGKHQDCPTRGIVIDDANCLVSTPAYMQKAPLAEVATGITELVRAVLTKIKTGKDAA